MMDIKVIKEKEGDKICFTIECPKNIKRPTFAILGMFETPQMAVTRAIAAKNGMKPIYCKCIGLSHSGDKYFLRYYGIITKKRKVKGVIPVQDIFFEIIE